MSNSNVSVKDKGLTEYIFAVKTLYRIISEIGQITQRLYDAAVEKRWELFCDLTNERQSKLIDVQGSYKEFDQMKREYTLADTTEIFQIKEKIRQQLKKVTKVNTEVIDIISNSKDELSEKIGKSTRGLAFLKNYGNQVNYEKTISKIY